MQRLFLFCLAVLLPSEMRAERRAERFDAVTPEAARAWQRQSRAKLFQLMMGGDRPQQVPRNVERLQRIEIPAGGYVLEELTLQTLPDRRAHVWLSVPQRVDKPVGAVLALHGHGGTGEEIVRGRSLYWYGKALAEMGYVVISPDIGQHELQHTNWTLMGERVWDALRCLDYLETLPQVDRSRMAVAGLSLGGETAMYVAALDERVRVVCSSGWLTRIDNMKNGHCPCWNFPGLEEHFDFADIFACIAPRPLVCEIGQRERAPGGFPVEIARPAFEEIRQAYRVLDAADHVRLDIHPNGHIFHGVDYWGPLHQALGTPPPWSSQANLGAKDLRGQTAEDEALRRGEIGRRLFTRARGVLDGWWALRDPQTSLFPRRTDQPVWAPQDNAADMLPFLVLTAYYLAPDRLDEVMSACKSEKKLTCRLGPLPDWYALTNHAFLYPTADLRRILFGAAEYCKDGLVPMTEVMGRGSWTERMIELMDAIFEQAPVPSAYGALPADDTEVNGDVLQALARLHGLTGDDKYLVWGERIGDAYCLEVLPSNGGLPPHRWDFSAHRPLDDLFNLNDHGNEILGGLVELWMAARVKHPEKAAHYDEPLRTLFQRLLEKGRNEDGFWVGRLQASSAQIINDQTPDTWGYPLSALVTFAQASGNTGMLAAARQALERIDQAKYLDWSDADAYADSVEGALLLLNRFPEPATFRWLEKILPLFLSKQQENGIVEGWYGDGNYARTALMAGLYCTQGIRCRPWRNDLRLGAVQQENGLLVALQADQDWEGELSFDTPRHQTHLHLATNYPRLNEFPEWCPVSAQDEYEVSSGSGRTLRMQGHSLSQGLPLQAKAGQPVFIALRVLRTLSLQGHGH